MDSCPRSLDNTQLERELPHCLSAKEGVWAWSTTNGLKLQPLSGQAEKWRKEGRRAHISTLKTLKNEPISPFPPKLRPKSTGSTHLRTASHKDIFSPSFPFISLTQKTCRLISSQTWSWNFINSTPHGKQRNETCHNNTSMPYHALYKTFTVTYASRNPHLELTDQLNLDSAIPIRDLLEP